MKVGDVLEIRRHMIHAASPPWFFACFNMNSLSSLDFETNSGHKVTVLVTLISSILGLVPGIFLFTCKPQR